MPEVIVIAALDDHRAIGRHGDIPWRIAEDWKRFKNLTMGYPIIMGRLTFESLPSTLTGRKIIVVSRRSEYQPAGADVASSVRQAIDLAITKYEPTQIFIGGGSSIYKEALPFSDMLMLTHVHGDFDGDTFFPEYKEFDRIVSREQGSDPKHSFEYVNLRR